MVLSNKVITLSLSKLKTNKKINAVCKQTTVMNKDLQASGSTVLQI